MYIKTLTILLTVMASTLVLNAQITAVDGVADIKFDSNATGHAAWQKIYVVSVIHPQIAFSTQSAGLLSRIKTNFSEKNVEVFAIIPGTLQEAKKFAAANPEFDFTLCAESDPVSLKKMLGENFQAANIFNYSGKLLWSGEPIDLPMMLKIITDGKYNERDEIRMSALISRMQAALRSGDLQLIGQSADQVLDVRPEQLSAVNAKLYSLEMQQQYSMLEQFLRDRIKRFPQEPGYLIMLIEAAFRIPVLNHIAPELALSYFEKFPQDLDNINSIAWSLLHILPFNSDALETADRACEILQSHPDSLKSRFLATRALAAYRRCQLQKAIELTTQALAIANNDSEKVFLNNMLEYFKHLNR